MTTAIFVYLGMMISALVFNYALHGPNRLIENSEKNESKK